MPDPRFKQKPLNGCSGCRRDFTSTTLFDRHRVGTYEYTLEQGLELDPPREDGRRCLDSGVALRSLRFLVQLGVSSCIGPARKRKRSELPSVPKRP